MADPLGKHWGYELSKKAGLRSGIGYPALTRLVRDGWLVDGWEEPPADSNKRPPRRYYQLTDTGRQQLGSLLANEEGAH
jgi:PadR family transcriptional regulator, regulatory protein PadR